MPSPATIFCVKTGKKVPESIDYGKMQEYNEIDWEISKIPVFLEQSNPKNLTER